MNTCRAMRPQSLNRLGREAVRKSLGCDARWAWDAPGRSFCVFRTIRDIHNGLTKAFELGESLAKSRLLPAAPWSTERPGNPPRRELSSTSSIASRSISGPLQPRCYSKSAYPTTIGQPGSLPEQLRSVMRLLPHSVVVCTAMHGDNPRAMTMSSFTSLTLSPTPLITFNVAVPSRTLDAIAASREFNIHVLAGDEAGAGVAHHFTKGNLGDDVFNDVEWTRSTVEHGDKRSGAPQLKGDGVLRILRCRILPDAPLDGLVRVRDHVIVVGEVFEMIPGTDRTEFGLAYAERRYRQVGGEIDIKP